MPVRAGKADGSVGRRTFPHIAFVGQMSALALLATAGLLIAAVAAQAATVGLGQMRDQGRFLYLSAAPGKVDRVLVAQGRTGVIFRDTAGIAVRAPGCRYLAGGRTAVLCARPRGAICERVNLGDRDDSFFHLRARGSQVCPIVSDGPGNDRVGFRVLQPMPRVCVAEPLANYFGPECRGFVVAGPGNDLYSGVDMLSGGGAGDDRVQGTAKNDILRGGNGTDTVLAGDGHDQILSPADGVADRLECGPGADHVEVDLLDVVAADCENVYRSATGVAPEEEQ